MVLSGIEFEVRDAKTGEDLTRSILLQIILEEETGGVPIFSATMLSQIIRFYGHAMQGMMGSYLEKNLQTFTDIQARLAEQTKGLYEPQVAVAGDVVAVPQRPGAGGPEADGQLPRAVEEHVRADAGADGQAGRHAAPGPAAERPAQALSGVGRRGRATVARSLRGIGENPPMIEEQTLAAETTGTRRRRSASCRSAAPRR